MPVREPDRQSLEELAAAVDETAASLTAAGSDSAAAAGRLLDALDELHRRGLVTLVRRLREDPDGKRLLFELVDEPEVRMLLSMHGLLRPDPVTATTQVLDRIRPGLQSHGGDVELSHVDDGVAYVRLRGACNGCSMAAVTMRQSVESAVTEGVPGVSRVEVLPGEPAAALIPVAALGVGAPAEVSAGGAELIEAGWCRVGEPDVVPEGELRALTITPADGRAAEVIVVNLGGQLSAYHNECAHQGLPLDDALLDVTEGTLTCPWHGFCYDAASGECLSMPGAQLGQLPLRIEGGSVWVRPGGG